MTPLQPACVGCGWVFAPTVPRIACPQCGDTRRACRLEVTASMEALAQVNAKQKRADYPGDFVTNMTTRTKRSRHGKLAHEVLEIDRSDPSVTVKRHRVWEQQPDGSWEFVHEHTVTWPAKRRPRPPAEEPQP